MFPFRKAAALPVCFLLICCDVAPDGFSNIDPISRAPRPPGAPSGTCWERTTTPAVIETQTQKVLVSPAKLSGDGRVQEPPVYRTETRQIVVKPREESWFEILCAKDMTPEFIASMQRALRARGTYKGDISGQMSLETHQAIHSFQRAHGFDSPVLTIATARKLGLIEVDLSQSI